MPRPRTPLAKAEATGRTEQDPKRFRNRKEPKQTRPLGKASSTLDEMEQKAWAAFQREVPWLTESDRATVEAACILRARVWAGEKDEKLIGRLLSCLGKMGATPADRTKVYVAPEDEIDPSDEFLQ